MIMENWKRADKNFKWDESANNPGENFIRRISLPSDHQK